MLGRRGKSLRPANGNVGQTAHPSKLVGRKQGLKVANGKVFRKNAGFPWRRATQLG